MKQYTLCLHDLRLPARLGIYAAEIAAPQTVVLSLELGVDGSQCDFNNPDTVPCYAKLAQGLRKLMIEEHTPLCEQLAERIAGYCFEDPRILTLKLHIVKPDAVANARAGIRANFTREESTSL